MSRHVTTYAYDHLGRTTSVTDPLSGVTSYTFDANSNLTTLTDSVSNTTTYAYDNLSRMTSETDAASHARSYTYDANSRLSSRTDRNGRRIEFGYDNMGRTTQEQWIVSGSPIYTASYVYDAASRLTSASDGNSAYALTYNHNGLVTQIDNNGTPTGPRVVLDLGYDNLSRLTSQSATVASTDDFLNNYSYNAGSQLVQMTQQGQSGGNSVAAKRLDFTYMATGQVSTIDRYANLAGTQLVATSTYGYDGDGRMTSLSHDKGATNFNAYTWTYDQASRITGLSSADGTDSYTYDATSQVTAANHSYQANESYSYDANGNRTNSGYTTTTNNQLTSDGTYNYTYDNEGNQTRKTTIATGDYVTYTWDFHNRLTDVKWYTSSDVLTQHVNYVYDVYDRLIQKQVDPTGGGTFTTKQAFEYDASGNIALVYNISGSLTDRVFSGFDLNQVLADENGSGTVSWLLSDNQGTIRDVAQYNSGTNTTTVVNHLKYGSFGNITAQSNSAYQPLFAYTGQMWDGTTGLYYYHARWYDPQVGRFLSQDPLSFAAGDADLYRYVGNSPSNATDPFGLEEDSGNSANLNNPEYVKWLAVAQAEQPALPPPNTPNSLINPATPFNPFPPFQTPSLTITAGPTQDEIPIVPGLGLLLNDPYTAFQPQAIAEILAVQIATHAGENGIAVSQIGPILVGTLSDALDPHIAFDSSEFFGEPDNWIKGLAGLGMASTLLAVPDGYMPHLPPIEFSGPNINITNLIDQGFEAAGFQPPVATNFPGLQISVGIHSSLTGLGGPDKDLMVTPSLTIRQTTQSGANWEFNFDAAHWHSSDPTTLPLNVNIRF